MNDPRWSIEKITAWHNNLPWLRGCNFIPSTAINQIEMLHPDTFDEATIDRELGWAASLGFNVMRVYLHDLLWDESSDMCAKQIDNYLEIANRHGILTFLTVFDDCWHEPELGVPAPRPGVHNSGWLRSPGKTKLNDPSSWADLEAYVKDLARWFGDDPRVVAWDTYNEVTNNYLPYMSMMEADQEAGMAKMQAERPPQVALSKSLLRKSFEWMREVGPSQPLTSSIWIKDDELNAELIELSDFISFHHYRKQDSLVREIERLQQHARPIWCTEYLNRRDDCMFETHMPHFKEHKIAAINWGLVDGKTQTKWAWTDKAGGGEPEVWFHDIFRADGTPYAASETAFIKKQTGA